MHKKSLVKHSTGGSIPKNKDPVSGPTYAKNKRIRKVPKLIVEQLFQNVTKTGNSLMKAGPSKIAPSQVVVKETIIHDMGNGAKSAFNLQPISDSCYQLFLEEEEKKDENEMEIASGGKQDNQIKDSQQIVPETQWVA